MDAPAPGFTSAADALRAGKTPTVRKGASNAEIDQAAQEFEAVFLAQMMEHMFAGVTTDGPFGGGHAEGIFRSVLLQEYSKVLAKTDALGIADAVKAELLSAQEVSGR